MNLENRYLVLKLADIEKYLSFNNRMNLANIAQSIEDHRRNEERSQLKCIVIESDWPEYKPTLAALTNRVDAETANEIDNKHYCNNGKWWEIVRDVTGMVVAIGQNNRVLEYEHFTDSNVAYKQKNKWLTKHNMFCPG